MRQSLGITLAATLVFGATLAEELPEVVPADSDVQNQVHEQSAAEELLKRIDPLSHDRFNNKYSSYVKLLRGDVGKIDRTKLLEGDTDQVRQLLVSLAPLTGANDEMSFKFVEFRGSRDGTTLLFRQVIDGISADVRNALTFDEDGHVSGLTAHLIKPSTIDTRPLVLREEAIQHAISALELEIGDKIEDVKILSKPTPPTLVFGFMPEIEAPTIYWRIFLLSREKGLNYWAVVHAGTGETRVGDAIIRG